MRTTGCTVKLPSASERVGLPLRIEKTGWAAAAGCPADGEAGDVAWGAAVCAIAPAPRVISPAVAARKKRMDGFLSGRYCTAGRAVMVA
ncbi:hypothetical protein GCM10011504_15040 [Siccirubricoccus deserti]|nr:hypothetical protein GCM10011504_15040 [Siccirubricoccus deserti]